MSVRERLVVLAEHTSLWWVLLYTVSVITGEYLSAELMGLQIQAGH